MSVKILHTADWHIGKHLLKVDFADDMNLFFEWLINTIQVILDFCAHIQGESNT